MLSDHFQVVTLENLTGQAQISRLEEEKYLRTTGTVSMEPMDQIRSELDAQMSKVRKVRK